MKATIQRPIQPGKTGLDKTTEESLVQIQRAVNFRESIKQTIETTDATALTIWSESMPTNCGWHLRYMVMGYDTSGNFAQYHEWKRIKRGSGAPAVVATTTIETPYEDVAGWACTFSAAADGTISVSVQGAAGATVEWVAEISICEVPA